MEPALLAAVHHHLCCVFWPSNPKTVCIPYCAIATECISFVAIELASFYINLSVLSRVFMLAACGGDGLRSKPEPGAAAENRSGQGNRKGMLLGTACQWLKK